MAGTSVWIINGLIGFVGILGLLAASRAADEAFYVGGIIIFVAAVAYIFLTIHRYYERMESHTHDGTPPGGARH